MAVGLTMLFFLLKSKYRWKTCLCRYFLIVLSSLIFVLVLGESKTDCNNVQCVHGACKNGTCVCEKGWQGTNCEFCGGRLRLTNKQGFITDGPGNYSFDIQCTWLIETSEPNSTLWLRLEHFATECSWDHLYIFDGDSMFAPLLAAYSGLVLQDPHPGEDIPEVVASSGSAYLHFFSDVAYNMTGFNITYSVNSCPQGCLGQGVCLEDSVCTCNAGRTGAGCDVPICPKHCGKGSCQKEQHRCECQPGYKGLDCNQLERNGYWVPAETKNRNFGRASHQALTYDGYMWVFGGDSFQTTEFQVLRYKFNTSTWDVVTPKKLEIPAGRYGHSVVEYKGKAYVFGGLLNNGSIVNELWAFDMTELSWSLLENHLINCKAEPCPPLALVGHTANVVDEKMLVIFGHSPIYGYMSTVQEYIFTSQEWTLINASGAIVKGGYGHSSVFDPVTEMIYVHGGYHSVSLSSQTLANFLYMFDPRKKLWSLLTPSKTLRYLHSAAIINGMMIIFGGNTHNDTSRNLGAKCYSTDFLAYDLYCDVWYNLPPPSNLYVEIARFGHSAVVHDGSMYIYGGFNGRMLNDILVYTPGTCDNFTSNTTCVEAHPGVKCVWNRLNSSCDVFQSVSKNTHEKCPHKSVNYSSLCESITSCMSCLHTSYECVWCGNFCSYKNCKESTQQLFGVVSNGLTLVAITPSEVTPIRKSEQCDPGYAIQCNRLHNCHACQVLDNCLWEADKECYNILIRKGNHTERAFVDSLHQCSVPCSQRRTCENCTSGPCIWCGVEKRCVESNAYVASFPYGQCMEWTTQLNKCPAHTCSEIKTCEKCHENPMCGWCDDGSGTGLGICLEGGSRGPMVHNSTKFIVDHNRCPTAQWYFTSCPKCQCNGHSTCANNSNNCSNCQDLTEGEHCEYCINGFYGDPTNGGNCTACDCNHHSTSCNRETGKCYCTTKGIFGNHCEKCDEQNHYYGDPRDGGTCFYDLTIDFQFTFNLSKPDDRYYNQINFKNTPTKPDTDADFAIICSLSAFVNITVKTVSKPEKVLLENYHCTNFKTKFSHSEYSFGTDENTTFYVYVFDFQPPMWIQIAFSQQPKLDLLQFFITFSSCFLTLLIIAAILWKIKQKYDLYRRRQRLFVEMEQMASRPFASVLVEVLRKETDVDEQLTTDTDTALRKRKKDRPSPIALEPCFGNRAAVLSLIVRLPTGEEAYTPPGQSGIAIASALVTLGNPRKTSMDTHKSDGKGKGRKQISHQHPDTCI